jgi:hypothetical protein
MNILKPKNDNVKPFKHEEIPYDLKMNLIAMKFDKRYKRTTTLKNLYKELVIEGATYDDARDIALYIAPFLYKFANYTIEELVDN